MRAEDTLQFMFDFYPNLFPTRKHCLDHLFCTVGNGYKWKNGELVEDDEYTKRYKLKKPMKKAISKNEEMWKYKNENELRTMEILGSFHKPNPKYIFNWSSLSKKYSYLYNYPDDIKEDWKELLEECKQELIKDGIKI